MIDDGGRGRSLVRDRAQSPIQKNRCELKLNVRLFAGERRLSELATVRSGSGAAKSLTIPIGGSRPQAEGRWRRRNTLIDTDKSMMHLCPATNQLDTAIVSILTGDVPANSDGTELRHVVQLDV